MRIAVDATCWANGRGYGRFTRELCAAMVAAAPGDEFTFLADAASAERFELEAGNARLVEVATGEAAARAASADGYRSPRDMLRLTRAVSRAKPDVFFSPSVYSYFPLPPRQRAVVTLHDAIAERFPELTLPSTRARLFWRAKVALAVRQARLILTVSEHAARDLERVLDIPRARLRVASEAPSAVYLEPSSPAEVEAAARAAEVPAGAPWFTYVGGFNPHKHVDVIVRAHARVAAGRDPAPHLCLVGTVDGDVFHGDQGRIRAAVRAAGTEPLVHWTGWLADADLRPLHAGATALLLPSACEGFGLPAVEAAAAGAAVVATTESPLPELLEGGGVFVPPGDEDALAAAMARLLDEPAERGRMGARARERAAALSWPRAAEVALEALREAAR